MKTLSKYYKCILAVGYAALFAPFVYSVFYSMPANDDFAWALEWWSSNRLVEVAHRVAWNYNNSFGQSGIFAIMIQVLLNPLYWFKNAGHSFGICMIIACVLIFGGLLIALRRLFIWLCGVDNSIMADSFTYLAALLLFTSYYYSDVYNWWSGLPGYAFMMTMWVITLGNIVKYEQTHSRTTYIGALICGMVVCTSMMYCIPTGLFYLVYVLIINRHSGDSFLKKAAPLLCYIIAGILMVIAPGNGTRMGNESNAGSSLTEAIYVTTLRVIGRAWDGLANKPWIAMLLLIIVATGMAASKSLRTPKLRYLILGLACTFIAAWGAVLPYVYGSGKSIESEFTPRIYFVEDYIVFIGVALLAFRFGQWLAVKDRFKLRGRAYRMACGVVLLLGMVLSLRGSAYRQIIPLDIVDKSDLIKESWYFWDDILAEVENAEQGSDIVIDRVNVDWCQYSYYVSLDEIPREPIEDGFPYGNCNQCASKFYGVRSIIVNLYDE